MELKTLGNSFFVLFLFNAVYYENKLLVSLENLRKTFKTLVLFKNKTILSKFDFKLCFISKLFHLKLNLDTC